MDTEHIIEPVRQLEVFTGAGRRRTWRGNQRRRRPSPHPTMNGNCAQECSTAAHDFEKVEAFAFAEQKFLEKNQDLFSDLAPNFHPVTLKVKFSVQRD